MSIARSSAGNRVRRGQFLKGETSPIGRAIAEVLENRLCLSSVNVLTAFDGSTDGSAQAGVVLSGSTLYGTTLIGGQTGSQGGIYSEPITGGNPDLIGGFNGTNGSDPEGNLLLIGDTLFGVAGTGGASNLGVVYAIPITGGDPTVLATFSGANGSDPSEGLIVSNNILYGTTNSGGANAMGEVFSVPVTGGTISVLASFSGTDGKNPRSQLVMQDGILYGSTTLGGGFNAGTIFSVPISGGSPTVLADMSPSVGEDSTGSMVLLNNTLYGTADAGGTLNKGTVFSVPIAGGTPTVLFSFDNAHGAVPTAGLALFNGILYGTTAEGGASNVGEVFAMLPKVSTPTVLTSFDSTTGTLPFSTPILSNGILYGTTLQGASGNTGSVWSLPATSGATLTFNSTTTPSFGSTNTALTDIVVTALDANGQIVTGDTGPFTLSIASGPTGANMSGTTTVTPVNGVATFSGITVDTVGTYTLRASDIADAPGTSLSFNVDLNDTFKATAASITGVADTTLSPVIIQAMTAKGAVDTAYNGPVRVFLFSTKIATPEQLSGTTILNASNGVARFSDLSINVAGSFQLVTSADNFLSSDTTFIPVTIASNPTELNVGVDITKFPLPDGGLLAGGRATATLTLNNTTGTLASGVMQVQLYLVSLRDINAEDGSQDYTRGRPLDIPSLNHVAVHLPSGKSRTINVPFTVPTIENDGFGMIVSAVLTPISGFTLPTLTKAPVISQDTFEGVAEFGTVNGRRGVKMAEYFDSPSLVHFSLSGPGMGSIGQDQNQDEILNITGATAATNITISTASPFTLFGISSDGPIGSLNAPELNVRGSISFPDGARQIRLKDLAASALTLGGATPANISLGNLTDSSIVATAPIRSLAINSFSNTAVAVQSIQASSITSFSDRGVFAGNLATTGNLGQVLIRGSLTGDILAGTNLGIDNAPGGNDDTYGPATLSSVHVVGNVSASIIAAGLNVQKNGKFVRANFSLLSNSKIVAVRIDGSLSSDSLVVSALVPVKALIAGQRLTTANDPRFTLKVPD